jgi:uncharacterized protein (TIGR03435 family)
MELFAKSLSGLAGRQVVDESGLTGVYDLKLEWEPNNGLGRPLPAYQKPGDCAAPCLRGFTQRGGFLHQLSGNISQ